MAPTKIQTQGFKMSTNHQVTSQLSTVCGSDLDLTNCAGTETSEFHISGCVQLAGRRQTAPLYVSRSGWNVTHHGLTTWPTLPHIPVIAQSSEREKLSRFQLCDQ